eukprot:TRINITY_DN5740_c0_g1::TRINITY_DN5740_c0_g1_i1::g.14538::m.14538 TRINITY_DN5740_c0_g1::TRINITY_DN5740_c0_g1_i1::g.14538  ORF type:complete len:355 (+),score=58.59,sp/Q9HB90/RRAGC_HUMAN/65.36/6e-145,Gtr1_RagA/PF04670.7/7.3e-69,Arf/PF00025.16/6.7e-06,MMR_HSR1/PF01926.18/7.5e-05,MMR_HSR1/PF01926.18/1.9e+03,Ras/PF00071.17/0.00017,SRPRB/PF09439.5/0.00058,Miro/PF08477.8/0.00073,Miro/PF08477.8/5.2e+03,AAA_14/PF13173.1/0.14,AAA_14/PF13173.1/4e+03,AAA_14/PF13173.1/9.7e+03,AAA_16/PF13191.1/1,AAA_16/PF13191
MDPQYPRFNKSVDDFAYSSPSSFPRDLGYGSKLAARGSAQPEKKPCIILMGLRRSGKSSVQRVVFHKMSPHETLFLENTTKLTKHDISNSAFVQFQVWDFPGLHDSYHPQNDAQSIFSQCTALVFVIDAQDETTDALRHLHHTVKTAYKVNPKICFEVFIHKVDGLSDDQKIESQREIQTKATEDLADANLDHIYISFHLTSIYDHSIYEAFSKVIQKLLPELPTLEQLLDILIANSRIEKAFLFDVVSKVYVATDSSPVDVQCYELCSDMIDVVIDVSCIYGMKDGSEGLAFDENSSAVIENSNRTVLYLREVHKYLALVCLMQSDNFDKIGIVDYNFAVFKDAICQIADARR